MADQIVSGDGKQSFVNDSQLVIQRYSCVEQWLDDVGQARMAFDEITDGGVPPAAQQLTRAF